MRFYSKSTILQFVSKAPKFFAKELCDSYKFYIFHFITKTRQKRKQKKPDLYKKCFTFFVKVRLFLFQFFLFQIVFLFLSEEKIRVVTKKAETKKSFFCQAFFCFKWFPFFVKVRLFLSINFCFSFRYKT